MRTLVVYYSLTGTARAVATAIAKELGADVEELRCDKYKPGGWGFLRAAIDSIRGKLPAIDLLTHASARYDLVVVGGPVWTSHAATPVRAFLRREKGQLPATAFFVTFGGSGAERAFEEMQRLAGAAPRSTLAVRQQDVKDGKFAAAVSAFATGIRQHKAA